MTVVQHRMLEGKREMVYNSFMKASKKPKGRDLILEKEKPYHIVARSVEGRTIFPTEEERARFVVQMYAANVGRPGSHITKKNTQDACTAILQGTEIPSGVIEHQHDPLVTFFSFALVGNHYHFGLIGSFDNAISKYLQKLNIAFSKFFNLKYKRTGSLFATRFKAVAVTDPYQISVLVRYINIKNVLDVYKPKWQERGIGNFAGAEAFLNRYSYSSFPDLFLGRSSLFIPTTTHDTLRDKLGDEFLPRKVAVQEEVQDFLESRGMKDIQHRMLE